MITMLDQEIDLETAADFLGVQAKTIQRLCEKKIVISRSRKAGPRERTEYSISLKSLVEYQDKKEQRAQQLAVEAGRVSDGSGCSCPTNEALFQQLQIDAARISREEASQPTAAPIGSEWKMAIMNARARCRLPLFLDGDNTNKTEIQI